MTDHDISRILLEQSDRLFTQQATKEVLTAADGGEWTGQLWEAIEQTGLPLALVPEELGGVGLGGGDVARLIRRSAYHAVPLPLAETIVANWLWTSAGGTALEGSSTLAPLNPQDRITLQRRGDEAILSGIVHGVPWARQSQQLVVLASDEAGRFYLCRVAAEALKAGETRRNVAYEPRETIDLTGTILAAIDVAEAPASIGSQGLMPLGAAIRSQQMIGGMERCLDYALLYANERVQFGRPIGKFQAIQHMLAAAAGQFAAASAAADALTETDGLADNLFAVAVAKARAGEAAGIVAAACHQVHGAMGFTREHPLHFASRRLWAWRDECGAETYWQEWLGQMICQRGGDSLWPTVVDGGNDVSATPAGSAG
jgi:acyl-CoA dehydrogenase